MKATTKQRLKLSATAALLGMLTACAIDHQTDTPKLSTVLSEQTGQDGRACVRQGDIRGFAANGDSVMIPAGRRYYIATTLYRCIDLQMTPVAIFPRGATEMCGGNARMFIPGETCVFDKIFEFENRKEAHAALDKAEEHIDELKKQASKTDAN